jgi:dolichyl-phosphate beta-glucosyltransferase
MRKALGTEVPLSLVVPVFNEEDRVRRSVPLLATFVSSCAPGSELIFVDDGSTDQTCQVIEGLLGEARDLSTRVIRRPHLGKGAAVSAGIEAATRPYVGFCDVDLATSFDDVRHLLDTARGAHALAIGSRALPDSRIIDHERRSRELLGRAYNRLIRMTLAPEIFDTQCGAKVAPREVWDAVLARCKEPGFAWDVEVVGTALALGIEVREVPVTWAHDHRTKVRVMRDGVGMVLALAGIHRRIRALRRSPVSLSSEDHGLVVLVDDAPAVE